MPLNSNDQITILTDILNNHQVDCCGTVAECQQMERLIQSLLKKENINHDMNKVLNDVYLYSQQGQNSQHLDNYISNHKNELSHWIDNLSQYKLT